MVSEKEHIDEKKHIDDKILRLFRKSTEKNKDKNCPKNIKLSDLEKAMGDSRDAQVHIKSKSKDTLWGAYYQIMLKSIDSPFTESSAFGDQQGLKITKNMNNNKLPSNKSPVWITTT